MSMRIRVVVGASLCLLAGMAVAVELPSNLPKRKPGLWEMQMGGAAAAHGTTKMCIDAATDQAMYQMGAKMSGALCSKMDFKVNGNTVLTDSVCQMPMSSDKVTLTSHSETRFDGDTSYQVTSHVKYSPAFMGKTESDTTSGGHWISACAAGQKPGDMILPNGMVMNINAMMEH